MQEYKVTVDSQGTVHWRDLKTDKIHRVDGPAIEYADGSKEWYVNGKRDRADGPAVEWASGAKFWFVNGERHRTDGPAIEWAGGYKSWFLNGVRYTESEFNAKINSGSCEGKEIEIDGVTYTLKVKE